MRDIREYEVIAVLDLSGDERELLGKKIEALEKGYNELDKIETSDIEPLVNVIDECNIMREDISQKLFTRDGLLENAPEREDGFFKVPGTI